MMNKWAFVPLSSCFPRSCLGFCFYVQRMIINVIDIFKASSAVPGTHPMWISVFVVFVHAITLPSWAIQWALKRYQIMYLTLLWVSFFRLTSLNSSRNSYLNRHDTSLSKHLLSKVLFNDFCHLADYIYLFSTQYIFQAVLWELETHR